MIVPSQTVEALTMEDEKANAKTGADSHATAAPPGLKKGGRSRAVKFFVLFVVLAAAGVGAKKLWAYFDSYESTDDAQIEGHLNGVGSRSVEQ
jgi:multidrug resistance efflux pump